MKKNKIKVGDIVLCIGAGRPQEVVAIKRHLFSTNYMVRDHGYNSRYLKEAQLKEITLLYQKPPLHPMQNDTCPRCKLSINHPMSPVRQASSVGTTYRDGNEELLFLMLAIGLVVLGLLYLLCVQSYAPSGYSVFDNGMVMGVLWISALIYFLK